MQPKASLAALACASALGLSACGQDPGTINIRETWGKSFSNLGMTAVYPMREDFYVGDIFLTADTPCMKDGSIARLPEGILLGSLTTSKIVPDYYGGRPQFPKASSAPKGSVGADGTLPINPQSEASDIFRNGRPFTRLRLASFPAFSLGSFSRAELGATAGAGGGLGRLFGISSEDSSRIAVTALQVEEVQLTGGDMIDAILRFVKTPEGVATLERAKILEPNLRVRQRDNMPKGCEDSPPPAKLIFINRVFYAQAMDFDFGTTSALAVTLGAALKKADEISQRPGLPGTPDGGSANTGEATANALAKALGALAGTQPPGFGASLAVGHTGTVVLRQAFERPLAFAADPLFAYDLQSLIECSQDPRCVPPPSAAGPGPLESNPGHVPPPTTGTYHPFGGVFPKYDNIK